MPTQRTSWECECCCRCCLQATARGSVAFVVSWLTAFKALAAVWGGGPVGSSNGSLLQQAALLLLPLTQQHQGAHSIPPKQQQLGLLPEVSLKLAAGLGVILLLHSAQMPTALRHVLYGEWGSPAVGAGVAGRAAACDQLWQAPGHVLCTNRPPAPSCPPPPFRCTEAVIVWLAVSVLLDFPAALLGRCLGLQLAPAMDSPLVSTGLADFWGRRYNRAVSAVLRHTVYQPVLLLLLNGRTPETTERAAAGAQGRQHSSRTARAIATTAAFAASGLMHELCTW